MSPWNGAMKVCCGVVAVLGLACSSPSATDPAPAEKAPAAPAEKAPAAPAEKAPTAPAEKAPAAPAETAPAAPKADPKMSPADRAAYRSALRDGRTAHRAKDYAKAIAAFDRALTLFVDDPRALNERGWARYKAGDLDGAEADTRSAMARTVDAKLVGASWYNLGRIAEDRGQTEQTKAAYRASLVARPNEIVRARLARLDPAVASPLKATPLAGPFADDKALCAHLLEAAQPTRTLCKPPEKPAAEGAPFGARLAHTYGTFFDDGVPGPDEPGTETWHLVLDVPAGRFVLAGLASTYNPGAFGIFEEVTINPPTTRTLADGRTVLWVSAKHDRSDSDMGLNEIEMSTDEYIFACGVGPSGVPACVGPLRTRISSSREILHEEDEEPGMEHDLWSRSGTFTVNLLDSGQLDVRAVGTPSKGIDQKHVGMHRLEFP